jgi:hypothetical protein
VGSDEEWKRLLRPARSRSKVPKMGGVPADYGDRKRVEKEKLKRAKRSKRR